MQPLLIILAVVCFGSFAWGMIMHFTVKEVPTAGMKLVAALGAGNVALQFTGLRFHLNGCVRIAAVIYLLAAALFWSAVRVSRAKLAACGQGATSTVVLRNGPYRYIRHPFYTSYNLAWIAGFVAADWWPLLLASITMGTLYEHFARLEERDFAAGPLGREYTAYKNGTGKYLPLL